MREEVKWRKPIPRNPLTIPAFELRRELRECYGRIVWLKAQNEELRRDMRKIKIENRQLYIENRKLLRAIVKKWRGEK